jgi:galactose mutarotase-like enzyme
MDLHRIALEGLEASIAAEGAELRSLRHPRLGEVMWGAGPAWPRVSPVLFPVVGRLAGDRLRVGGRDHPMKQHGFARDRRFEWAERGASSCRLVLEDDEATRAAFPFAFRLGLSYALAPGALRVGYRVTNTGETPLPASLGAHPAFRWPLREGAEHRIVFADEEPAPVRRLRDGLLDHVPRPTPVQGRTLPLSRALFEEDALILDAPRSRALRYEAGDAALEVAWEGFAQLGLWSKGDFLCIEPWHGFADSVGFSGDFFEKPGIRILAPGEAWDLAWSVTIPA